MTSVLAKYFEDLPPNAETTKGNINKWDHIKLKSTGNHQQHEKETYQMGGNICKVHICSGINNPKYMGNSRNSIAKSKSIKMSKEDI